MRWTKEETEQLKTLLKARRSVREIALRMGKKADRIRHRIETLQRTREEKDERNARRRFLRSEDKKKDRVHANAQIILSQRPTEEMLAERDERYSAPFRDLSGFAFGDPPIGYSALDRT